MYTHNEDRAGKPDGVWYFSRRPSRGYMMRSEKRTPPRQTKNGRRVASRRRRAGFFYSFFTLIFSLVLWPIGMIMLWKRKLRWSISTKLLTTIITMFLTFTVAGYLLTVPTDNPKITKAQDNINDFLDNSAHFIADSYTAICDGAVQVWNSASDLGSAMSRSAMRSAAEAIDQGIALTASAKETVTGWIDSIKPTAEPTAEPTVEPTTEPTGTPTVAPTATATAKPSAEATVPSELPLIVPENTPDPASAQPIGEGTLNRDREFAEATEAPTHAPTDEPTSAPEASVVPEATATAEVTSAPTQAPTPTVEPTPTAVPSPSPSPEVPAELMPDSPDQAIVYYTSNGRWYHMAAKCKSMSNAQPHLLTEALAKGLKRCNSCKSPEASVLELENAIWVDEACLFHLSAECEAFTGKYALLELDAALMAGYAPCADCRADAFMTACGRVVPTPTPVPTAEPTATPTPVPTATPEPEIIIPTHALKPAGEAMVYHTTNGGWYHTKPYCSNMRGADLYPLSEAAGHLKRCRKCNAPMPEYVDQYCLWMDEDSLCHTTDECAAFNGKYSLIPRDEALEAGHTGCPTCGANEYLKPNSIVEYIEYIAPTEAPGSTAK